MRITAILIPAQFGPTVPLLLWGKKTYCSEENLSPYLVKLT